MSRLSITPHGAATVSLHGLTDDDMTLIDMALSGDVETNAERREITGLLLSIREALTRHSGVRVP